MAWIDQPDPPEGSTWRAAQWLAARHPTLLALARRVDVVSTDGDGDTEVDIDALAALLVEHQAHQAAWAAYTGGWQGPRDEEKYEQWVDAGPQPSARVARFGPLSGTEKGRLRLLATLSTTPTPWTVHSLWGFDAEGASLIADWFRAVRAAL